MKVKKLKIKNENAMRLQGVGWFEGTPARELKVGNVTMWNYGELEYVESIISTSKNKMTIAIRTAKLHKTGEVEILDGYYHRTLNLDRLVVIGTDVKLKSHE